MGESDRDIGRLEGKMDSVQRDLTRLTDLIENLMANGCSKSAQHNDIEKRVTDLEGRWWKMAIIISALAGGGATGVQKILELLA